jgi:hypothetical protein
VAVGSAIALLPGAASASPDLRVRGSQLIDGPGAGHVVQIRGVNRSGLEYACIQGTGFFDSPRPNRLDTRSMIAAMASWDINAVRVPLNEDCWLGLKTPRRYAGGRYREVVMHYVRALEAAHLYVVLDLHWAAPGSRAALRIARMPDRDHAPAFWRSVARAFKHDHALMFDLYNEPHDVGWRCWLRGCEIRGDGSLPRYRAAGMQELVDAVRATGAGQPLLLGGTNWALDLSGWLGHEPRDPLHQLVAAEHNYGRLAPCGRACRAAILATRRKVPVLFGEVGETDCRHGYIDSILPFADKNGIGYVGWAWDAGGGWTCKGGPTLIEDYRGTPTPFGMGFRDHLLDLGMPYKPL